VNLAPVAIICLAGGEISPCDARVWSTGDPNAAAAATIATTANLRAIEEAQGENQQRNAGRINRD
jgi:hypothetical protein